MAQGKSPKRPWNNKRKNRPRQGQGQQNSALQSAHQPASGQNNPHQTVSHQNSSPLTSHHQGSGQQNNRHQNSGQQTRQNRQRLNTRPWSQQNTAPQNPRPQSSQPVASSEQSSSQQNSENNHGPNAEPESTTAPNTTHGAGHQNSGPQASGQNNFGHQNNQVQDSHTVASSQENSGAQISNRNSHGSKTQLQSTGASIISPENSGHQNSGQVSGQNNSGHRSNRPQDFGRPKYHKPDAPHKGNQQNPSQDDVVKTTPRLTPLQMLHDFTKEWSPDLHHNFQPFAMLPRDIVLEIMDHLDNNVDKVSLALTTKTVWEWTKDKLHLEYFNLPQVLPARATERHGIVKPWPYLCFMRWKLLERLEDENWKCCSGCLRLHTKTEFFPHELTENPPNKRFCRAPGLIQICPHFYLTYKKCAALQKVLADFEVSTGGTGYDAQGASLSKQLYHECHLMAGVHEVSIGAQPYVTGKNYQLVVRQRYVLQINSEKVKESLKWIEREFSLPYLCPHRSIITHCLDMLDMPDGKWKWNPDMISGDDAYNTSTATCRRCGTTFYDFKHRVHASSKKCRIEFLTSKNIGKGYELKRGRPGHARPDLLRDWVHKTDLANAVVVDDIARTGCKCRPDCRFVTYKPIKCHSPVASLPERSWKEAGTIW